MSRVVLVVVGLMACLWSSATPAHALPAPQATTCTGVWVVVDYGALGGTSMGCAGSYSTGMAALRSVPAFTPTLDNGLVVKIGGLPTTPNVQENYWSYWHASRQADGSYSNWSYANTGPSSYKPIAGDAEGWRYESVSGGEIAPGTLPPKQTATTQAPATTAPAPAPATRATTRATTAAAQTTQAAPPASTPPDSPSPTDTPTPSDTGSPSTTPTAVDSSLDGPTVTPAAPTSTSTSSLYGGLGAIAAIAAGTGGMLVWRRRAAAKG